MAYCRVLLKKSVDKDLRRVNPIQVPRIIEAIKELATNPFPSSSRKLGDDIKSLKSVPSWQTLNMMRDAIFAYDVMGVEEIFKDIDKARKYGIFYDEKEKVFKLRKRGRIVFHL
jgi:hypothetical protein